MQTLSGFIKDGNIHNIDKILSDQGLFAMLLHFTVLLCIGIEILLL